MRLFRYLTALLILSLASAPVAYAKEESVLSSIAVIDVQRVLQESLAAKSVQKQLEAQRSKFQTEIAKEETELRQSEQDLAKSRETEKPDIYADREQKLRQRFLFVERHVQSRRKALDQAFTDSMNVVRNKLLDIVGDFAKEKNVSLVVVKQQALWSDKKMDITDDVLLRLNKDLTEVTVKVTPEVEPGLNNVEQPISPKK